jgi:hypothetical protein
MREQCHLRVPTRDTFNMAAVNRHWFTVASSPPRLWNELYVNIDWNAVTLTNALQQTLARLRDLGLSLNCQSYRPTIHSRRSTIPQYMRWSDKGEILHSIEGLLAPVSSRICSLAFGIAGCSDGVDFLYRWSSPLPAVRVGKSGGKEDCMTASSCLQRSYLAFKPRPSLMSPISAT